MNLWLYLSGIWCAVVGVLNVAGIGFGAVTMTGVTRAITSGSCAFLAGLCFRGSDTPANVLIPTLAALAASACLFVTWLALAGYRSDPRPALHDTDRRAS